MLNFLSYFPNRYTEKGSSEKKRDKVREAVQEIRGKGSNQIKPIHILDDFDKHYPHYKRLHNIVGKMSRSDTILL